METENKLNSLIAAQERIMKRQEEHITKLETTIEHQKYIIEAQELIITEMKKQ